MQVYHYACPGRNVGDNALVIGLKRSFKKHDIILKTHNLRATKFTPSYIAKINKEAKAIVIGGGGLLHCSPAIRKLKKDTSGTLIQISKANIQKIKIPSLL